MSNKEIKYLRGMLIDIGTKIGDTSVPYSEGKTVMGVIGDGLLTEYFACKTLIDTVINLDEKIRFSLDKAIYASYSKEVINNFDIMKKGGKEEFLAYYYIENAIYRTSTIWDCLAQLYNLHYSVGERKDRIHYKTFFNNMGQEKKFRTLSKIPSINQYLNEKDDTNTNGRWLGNHQYIKDYRNKLTHRNSPDEVSLSNYDFNLKTHPSFILKRLIEDYHIASSNFIEISKEVMNSSG